MGFSISKVLSKVSAPDKPFTKATSKKMDRKSERLLIEGRHGQLSAIMESPVEPPKAIGLFSHCFSCTKDLKAIVNISRALAEKGYAVVRFDFTGLGQSEGDFSNTDFLDNLQDVRDVYQYVSHRFAAPRFLIGHSLGGSAMMATAAEFDSVEAVSVIASPAETTHLADTINRLNPAVESVGEGMVNTGTYEYLIKKPTIKTLREYDLPRQLKELDKRILVFHSPEVKTLGFRHAELIATHAKGPTSVFNLESSNHLLTDNPKDIEFIATVLCSWFDRYLNS